MLQAIRDGIKGWIAWVIVGFIALPFVFMGGYEYFGGGADDAVVARVNGEEIPRAQVEQQVERQRARLREMFGGEVPDGFDAAALRREAVEQLIDETLLYAYVDRKGLRVGDDQVARTIRNQEIFQEGGSFSRERYQTLLQRNRLTPEDYERLVRRDLMVEQLQEAVFASSAATPSQLARIVRLQDETRSFAYLEIPADRFLDEVEVSEADVEAHYEENTDDYMAPEAVRLDYVELHLRDLAEEFAVSEDDLQSRYDSEYGDDDDAPAFEEVRDDLKVALLREEAGEQFIEWGNDLGNIAFEQPDSLQPAADHFGLQVQTSDWIDRDGGPGIGEHPEVVEAAFSEDVFEYDYNSDLIEPDDDRYLVVRLAEHREAQPKPLEEVADSILEELRIQRAGELARERADELLAALRDERSLEEVAEDLDVELREVSGIQRDDRGHPVAVLRSAFGLSDEGDYAVAELDDGAVALLRLDQVQTGDPDGLSAQERQQLLQQLRGMAGETELRSLIRALRADADIEIAEDRL